MSEVRPYDVVLFGATGFTGRLVAEALARRGRETPLSFALAGRNTEKLEAVRSMLEARGLASERVGLIEADAGDTDSLLRMAARGRVLVSTVGPYLHTGMPVVAACVQASTDYADITGEADGPPVGAGISREFRAAPASISRSGLAPPRGGGARPARSPGADQPLPGRGAGPQAEPTSPATPTVTLDPGRRS